MQQLFLLNLSATTAVQQLLHFILLLLQLYERMQAGVMQCMLQLHCIMLHVGSAWFMVLHCMPHGVLCYVALGISANVAE